MKKESIQKANSQAVKYLSKRKKILYIIVGFISIVTVGYILKTFYQERALETTKQWIAFDAVSDTGAHISTKFSNLLVLVSSEGDTKGVALYDDAGFLLRKKKYYDYNYRNLIKETIPRKINPATEIEMIGPYSFVTLTNVYDGFCHYTIAFYFVCEDFLVYFSLIAFIIIATLSFFSWVESGNRLTLLDLSIGAVLDAFHDTDSIALLGKEICLNDDPSLKKEYLLMHPIVELKRHDMLNFTKKAEIIKEELIDINSLISDFNDAYVKDRSHLTWLFELNATKMFPGEFLKVRSIYKNLFDNGYKYSTEIVKVVTFDDEASIGLTVATTGTPFTDKQIKRICEPLFRFSDREGTGIGMHTVKRYVEAHNGKMVIKSEGGFNIFTITFPSDLSVPIVARKKEEVCQNVSAQKIPFDEFAFETFAPKLRVGLLDDDARVKMYLKRHLKSLNPEVDLFPLRKLLLNSSRFPNNYDAIFVDRFCEGSRDMLVEKFGEELRQNGFKGALILYSSAIPSEMPECYDFSIYKAADDLNQVVEHFAQQASS